MKSRSWFGIMLLIFMVIAVVACGKYDINVLPVETVCDSPEAVESRICEITKSMGTTPEKVDLILQLAAAVALDANPREAHMAMKYLQMGIDYLNNDNITYALFASQMKTKMPLTFQVATNGILGQLISIDSVISPYDQYLLKVHLDHQMALVRMSMGNSYYIKNVNGKLVSTNQMRVLSQEK